jgi:hypothetical protein
LYSEGVGGMHCLDAVLGAGAIVVWTGGQANRRIRASELHLPPGRVGSAGRCCSPCCHGTSERERHSRMFHELTYAPLPAAGRATARSLAVVPAHGTRPLVRTLGVSPPPSLSLSFSSH